MPSITTSAASRKSEKLAQRISYILALLHQGDAIDKHQLAQIFDVDLRTIERDLGERLHGIAERSTEGRWQLAKQMRGSIPAQHLHRYARLVGTEHLFPDSSLCYLLTQLEAPSAQRSAQVQPTSREDLRGRGLDFSALQTAIERRCECRFTYKAKPRQVQPYRLIHRNGVWYLAADEGGRLKNFSVALIEGLQVDEARHFTQKQAHQRYIDTKDDIWFTDNSTEVLLRVSPAFAHYFSRRALLPQQQQHLDADGSLLVSAHINHINQLLPVVRYWLPHVRIVRPDTWHQALVADLKRALDSWAEDAIP